MKNLFQLYVFGVRIIVIFAFCSLGISNAVAQEGEVQESHPLLEEGKVWNYDFSYVEINFNRNQDSCTYWIDGDTIVDGKRLFHECVFDSNGFCAPSYETEANCCPDNNHPHAIDLGLPSGTKWACCNVGSTKPEEYGGYYAWGEIEEKEIYYWNTYIHCDGTEESCQDLGSDIAGTQYDVANMKWGGSWVMPSSDQIIELVNNCTYTWTSINGVWCGHFTGPSGSTIILPGAGYRFLGDLYHDSSRGYYSCSGYYWSSTQHPVVPEYTYGVYLDLGYADLKGFSPECGRSVRPVLSATNNFTNPITCSNVSDQAIYSIYGIKVADSTDNMNNLDPGIYIVNGKKKIIK